MVPYSGPYRPIIHYPPHIRRLDGALSKEIKEAALNRSKVPGTHLEPPVEVPAQRTSSGRRGGIRARDATASHSPLCRNVAHGRLPFKRTLLLKGGVMARMPRWRGPKGPPIRIRIAKPRYHLRL